MSHMQVETEVKGHVVKPKGGGLGTRLYIVRFRLFPYYASSTAQRKVYFKFCLHKAIVEWVE